MTIYEMIWDEKLQNDINREAVNISVLPSGKIDKQEYLTGEEVPHSNRKQITEKTKFAYSTPGKGFEYNERNKLML